LKNPYCSPTSGCRKYEPDAVHRMRFIKNAQKLRLTLNEIKGLLSILEDRKDVPEKFARKISSKKEQIEEKMEKGTAIRKVLDEFIEQCPEEGTVQDCFCVKEIAPEGHLEEFLKPFQTRGRDVIRYFFRSWAAEQV